MVLFRSTSLLLLSDYHSYILNTVSRKYFEEEKFRVLVQNEILRRNILRIAPVQLLCTKVRPQNFVEKYFADCSGPIIMHEGAATKFCGENFQG